MLTKKKHIDFFSQNQKLLESNKSADAKRPFEEVIITSPMKFENINWK